VNSLFHFLPLTTIEAPAIEKKEKALVQAEVQKDGGKNNFKKELYHELKTIILIIHTISALFCAQFYRSRTKGSLKNNFTFYASMHLFRLRCESSESVAADAWVFRPPLQRDDTFILKMVVCFLPQKRLNA